MNISGESGESIVEFSILTYSMHKDLFYYFL